MASAGPFTNEHTVHNPDSRFGGYLTLAVAFALSAVAVWTAWDDGGGHRWTQATAAIVILALIPAGMLLGWIQKSNRVPIYAVLAMSVWLIAALQCVPLPPDLVKALSPGSYQAYREWIPDEIRDEAAGIIGSPASRIATTGIPISVSPTFTRMTLFLPLVFGAGCWLSFLCFKHRRAAILLLAIPAVIGGLFAFFGLADMIRMSSDTAELRTRLLITPLGADGPFGPFINNNTCAGYLNLTIGCAIGLLLGLRHRAKEIADPGTLHYLQCVTCVVLIVVMVAGILGSNSRGGFLGLAAATIVLTLIGTRGWSRIGLVAALAVIACGSLYFLGELGIRDQTSDRLETLYDGTAQNDPRLMIWRDGLDASMQHLPMGAGFGTYRYANLPFQSRTGDHWAVNADGMHVEWLLEGGIWLIPILAFGIVLIIRDTRRVSRQIPEMSLSDARLARAITIAITFSLSSLFVTQSFDFGIVHVPLLLTFAVLVGGLLSVRTTLNANEHIKTRFLRSPGIACCLAVVMLAATGLASWDLHAGGVWQRMMIDRYAARKTPMHKRKALDAEIARLRELVKNHPGDAMAHRTLAQLTLDRQHQLGALALLDAKKVDDKSASRWSAPRIVRKASHTRNFELQRLMLGEQDAEEWRSARRHAVSALVLSPLDDTARVLLAETDFLDPENRESSGDLLVQVARLRPKATQILDYVEDLVEVYPRGDSLREVRAIIRRLRSKQ